MPFMVNHRQGNFSSRNFLNSMVSTHHTVKLVNPLSTVEPPNKGHVGDNINSAVLSFIERLSSFRGSKCTKTMGRVIFLDLEQCPCREVYYTVSLFRRVHYQRCHCIT